MAKKDLQPEANGEPTVAIDIAQFSQMPNAQLVETSLPFDDAVREYEGMGYTYDQAGTVRLRQWLHAKGLPSDSHYVFFN